MNWWRKPAWALDLETTGTDPLTCQVVSWALIRSAPTGAVLEVTGGIVNTTEWSNEAEAIHGVTQTESNLGMSVERFTDELEVFLARIAMLKEPLVIFNAPFDATIAARLTPALPELIKRLRIIDPLVLDRHVVPKRRGKGARRLGSLLKAHGVTLTAGLHDALVDARAAALLAYLQAAAHLALRRPIAELHEKQIQWAAEQTADYTTWKRKTEPTFINDNGAWPTRYTEATTPTRSAPTRKGTPPWQHPYSK